MARSESTKTAKRTVRKSWSVRGFEQLEQRSLLSQAVIEPLYVQRLDHHLPDHTYALTVLSDPSTGKYPDFDIGQNDVPWPGKNRFESASIYFPIGSIPDDAIIESVSLQWSASIVSNQPGYIFEVAVSELEQDVSQWLNLTAKQQHDSWQLRGASLLQFSAGSQWVGLDRRLNDFAPASWLQQKLSRASVGVQVGLYNDWLGNDDEIRALPGSDDDWWVRFDSDRGFKLVVDYNCPPKINSLSGSPDSVEWNKTFILTASGVGDPDESIGQVDFWRDSNNNGQLDESSDEHLGTDPSGSTWSWSGPAKSTWGEGYKRFFARATDSDGAVSNVVSDIVEIVEPPNQPPTIGSLGGSPNQVEWSQMLTLTAYNVNDPDGTINQVDFYFDTNGNGSLDTGGIDEYLGKGTKNGSDWSIGKSVKQEWGTGDKWFFAQAADNDWYLSNVAKDVTNIKQPPNKPPTIGWLEGTPETVKWGEQLLLSAHDVSDSDGIQRVDFYFDRNGNGVLEASIDEPLGSDTLSTDGWSKEVTVKSEWGEGSRRFLALARDTKLVWGNTVYDDVTIQPSANQLPTVQLEATPEAVYPGQEITLTALAADTDGWVTHVDFFVDSNRNGQCEPWFDEKLSEDWEPSDGFGTAIVRRSEWGTGILWFFARATDDDGATAYDGDSVILLPDVPPLYRVDSLADDDDGWYGPGGFTLREAIRRANETPGANSIDFAAAIWGGTIVLMHGQLAITDDLTINGPGAGSLGISGNYASRVLDVVAATVSISGVTIRDGFDAGWEGHGGGIRNSGVLKLSGVSVTANGAMYGGGIYNRDTGSLTIIGSLIASNGAGVSGAGIHNYGSGASTILNTIISGNETEGGAWGDGNGGGINNQGPLVIQNSTITGNVSRSGGGIINWNSLVLTSTIIAGNTAANGPDISGSVSSGSTHNLIQDPGSAGGLVNGVGFNLVGVDPRLGPLADNGGVLWTHALLAGSPAIGAGSNPSNLVNDQRGPGFLRVRFDPTDIGAFEVVRPTFGSLTVSPTPIPNGATATITASGVVDGDGPAVGTARFYLDRNRNGRGDDGELIGEDESTGTAFSVPFSTTGIPAGDYSILAVANDHHGHRGASTLSVTITPVEPRTYTVTVGHDEDDGDRSASDLSLREAILLANANAGVRDTIRFSSSSTGATITLGGTELIVTDGVDILGPGENSLTISGNDASRVLNFESGTSTISGLTIAHGALQDGAGGAIRNAGTLTIARVNIINSRAVEAGGIYNAWGASASLVASTLSGNSAGDGGAVSNVGTMVIDRCTINNNEASGGGGAIVNHWELTISSSTISGNNSTWGGILANYTSGMVEILASTLLGTDTLTWDYLGDDLQLHNAPPVRMKSTILAGRGGQGVSGAFTADSCNNLIELAGSAGGLINGANGNIIGVAPRLGPLADNGGPTRTHALLPGSPAIDCGIAILGTTTDQRGEGSPRVLGSAIDIGALEAAPLAVTSSLIGAAAGPTGNLNITARLPSGDSMIYQQQPGSGSWTKSELRAKTGSPEIIGDVVTWVDPKDGLTYASALTAYGLGLFTNTSGSQWTFRNLDAESPGFPKITGNLTTFTSIDGLVSIAGVAENGDLVRHSQTGEPSAAGYVWSTSNHAGELRDQGLEVPRFSGPITSFVTPWNALNIVGLDEGGRIQAVWWHPSLATGGRWTVNDLSTQTGAPTMTGGLTVWQTSWNAINIAGTTAAGELVAAWWLPEFGADWRITSMTGAAAGPALAAESVCSWVTSWGAMNIAGREENGTIAVYWWAPGFNNNKWNVAFFRDILPAATVTTGPVTGLTAAAGGQSMSILSTAASGDVMRLWWSPATNAWAEENLTRAAVPA